MKSNSKIKYLRRLGPSNVYMNPSNIIHKCFKNKKLAAVTSSATLFSGVKVQNKTLQDYLFLS